MALTQTNMATLTDGLAQIFPKEMDEKKLDEGQSSLMLAVASINSDQFAQLSALVVETNANIHMKRSGGNISIHLS